MRINRVTLAAEMTRRDLNNKQLGERAGLSRVTISAVKGGKSCSEETAAKLVAVLGANIIEQEA